MKVSIVIPCFNGEKFVGRAVRSALNQRFPAGELEVVVVDDGSSDHSREVIADCGDVVLVRHDENRGLPAARNTGIRKARGRYVLLVDADDYIHTDLAYVQHLHLSLNPHWGAVGCDYYLVDEHEQHISRVSGAAHPIACGIMFSRDALVDIGLYDEELKVWEDEDLRLRFMKRYHIGHVELPLYRYRKHKANLTNDVELAAEYRAKLRAKHAGG